jgi:hypothetical protein
MYKFVSLSWSSVDSKLLIYRIAFVDVPGSYANKTVET